MPDVFTHAARTGRRSWLGYARVLRSVYDGIDTAAALAPIHGLRKETMREMLRRMSALGLVHIAGSVRAANHMQVPRWAIGKEGCETFRTNAPLAPNLELVAFADMLRELGEQAHTPKSLAEACGLTRQRVGALLVACESELRIVFVAGYAPGRGGLGGARAALYRAGFDQPNASKPANIPDIERWRRERETKKRRQRWAEEGLTLTSQTRITIYPSKPAPTRTNTHSN